MSRHNRRVPTSFYYRFATDARNFANKYANGRLISVLEGGYSDRALISGGMAHLSGLVDAEAMGIKVCEEWWNVTNLSLVIHFQAYMPKFLLIQCSPLAREIDEEETWRQGFRWWRRRKMGGPGSSHLPVN